MNNVHRAPNACTPLLLMIGGGSLNEGVEHFYFDFIRRFQVAERKVACSLMRSHYTVGTPLIRFIFVPLKFNAF